MAGTKGKSGMNENSLKNLTNISEKVTPEQRKANGKKGGVASGKARREKRDMQKCAQDLLSMPIKKGKTQDYKSLSDASGKNVTMMEGALLKLAQQALNGNIRAFEVLRDTAGYKPVDKQEVKTELKGSETLADILQALKDD